MASCVILVAFLHYFHIYIFLHAFVSFSLCYETWWHFQEKVKLEEVIQSITEISKTLTKTNGVDKLLEDTSSVDLDLHIEV